MSQTISLPQTPEGRAGLTCSSPSSTKVPQEQMNTYDLVNCSGPLQRATKDTSVLPEEAPGSKLLDLSRWILCWGWGQVGTAAGRGCDAQASSLGHSLPRWP